MREWFERYGVSESVTEWIEEIDEGERKLNYDKNYDRGVGKYYGYNAVNIKLIPI